MGWNERCMAALSAEKMFENSQHQSRFSELLDCYSGYPFFTKGLCKCMYLSAWDEEHFGILLETLNDMVLGREKDTDDMKVQGEVLADENTAGEAMIYQLSVSFLEETDFPAEGHGNVSEHYQYLVRRGLEASTIIDSVY